MASYLCDEDARNLVLLEIENRKKALEVYPLIIPVLKKFDGKVLNKRLETALQVAHPDVRLDRSYDRFDIEYSFFNNRSIQSVNKDSNGYATTNYINGSGYSLATYLCTQAKYDTEKLMCDEDGRIKADVVLKALETGKKQMEDTIHELEAGIEKVDEWRKQMEKIKFEFEELNKEIPLQFKEYYKKLNYSFDSH